MGKRIKIFDTTLRDGEQSPGCSMNLKEKLKVAKQLEVLGVDVIEAGFAIASPGDFEAVKTIASEVRESVVASLSRALPKDIDRAWEAVRYAKQPRIHTFIATSDIHMQYKLKKTPEEVLQQTKEMVRYAKNYCHDIEFSAEDASRSDWDFLCRVFDIAIKEGATVINIPDTVGYTTPDEYYRLITYVKENTPGIDLVDISVHCHNDLGLAVANTLAAARAGATQLECTINGIGERAGNAALEELVMGLNTRKDYYNYECGINTKEIYHASRLISNITGQHVQANKAIVGANAFAHESGIHQHGVLANKSTYEIMTPESIGLTENKMVLGKHSGRHAFDDRLKALGFHLSTEEIQKAFTEFKELADKKKVVSDKDIEALVEQRQVAIEEIYKFDRFVINSGNTITATASVRLIKKGDKFEEVSTGDGPVDASFKAIDKLVGIDFKLMDYKITAVTEGKDAQGTVRVKIKKDGEVFKGRGLSTDIVEASVKAYLNAINKMLNAIGISEGDEVGEKAG